jgi:hypothetical protein
MTTEPDTQFLAREATARALRVREAREAARRRYEAAERAKNASNHVLSQTDPEPVGLTRFELASLEVAP